MGTIYGSPIVDWLTFAVGALGLGFALRSLYHLRTQTESALASVALLRAQQRAWVAVSNLSVDIDRDGWHCFRAHIVNVGKTPAVAVRLKYLVIFAEPGAPFDPPSTAPTDKASVTTLLPGSKLYVNYQAVHGTDPRRDQALRGKLIAYWWLWVGYEDVVSEERGSRHTQLCSTWDGDKLFQAASHHNDAS